MPLIIILIILFIIFLNYITIGLFVFIGGLLLPLPDKVSEWYGDNISKITFLLTAFVMYKEYSFIYHFIIKRIG